MSEQEQQIADLGFENSDLKEYPDDFYTGYQIEQEFKRGFNLQK